MTVVRCVSCGLRQFALSSACRRCRANLGFSIVEIPFPNEGVPNGSVRMDLQIGRAIRSMRLRQGKTQAFVAASARMGRAHLARLEANLSSPNLDTVLRILNALGVESLYVRLGGRSSTSRI